MANPDDIDEPIQSDGSSRPAAGANVNGADGATDLTGHLGTSGRNVGSTAETHFAPAGSFVATASGIPADRLSSIVAGVSSAILVAGLIGCVSLIGWTLLGPSADAMFASLRSAAQTGNVNRPVAQQFLEKYPEDPRVAEVQRWARDAEFETQLARLRARLRDAGEEPLTLAEASLMQIVDQLDHPERTTATAYRTTAPADRLVAWLQVHDSVLTPADPSGRGGARPSESLTHLARWLLPRARRAARANEQLVHRQELRALRQRIEKLPQGEAEVQLSALRTLYAGEPWAEGILGESD